jgi:hypothetical protein
MAKELEPELTGINDQSMSGVENPIAFELDDAAPVFEAPSGGMRKI